METYSDIYSYIKDQETLYQQEIEIISGWNWGMKEHIRQSILYKHGKFSHGNNDFSRPNKNIILPVLNLRYRAEDINAKDVALYVNDDRRYHLSFLVKKYHDEVYVNKKKLDTFFDETKEEKIDFGGTLVRQTKEGPAYEPLESIAFCDQTDILSGPIGFKLFFSPDELYEMQKLGWGDKKNGATTTIDELITLAQAEKEQDKQISKKNKTPGKYIEIYRVHGSLPLSFLKDEIKGEDPRYVRQLQIVAFYQSKDGQKTGVTLYRAKEYESPFKLHLSGKKIRNRALAYGGVEELFDGQIWTNYSEIRKKELIDAVSKIVRWTNDPSVASRNKISNMENNEFIVVGEGKQLGTLDANVPNVQLFNEWINEWQTHVQVTGGATDALMGQNPTSGTPFALQSLVSQQGQGLHDYRKGKFATFIHEIYEDWIIPDIIKEITNGVKFLTELTQDEMAYVVDCVVRNEAKKYEDELVLSGQDIDPVQTESFKEKVREEFMRGGSKRFLEILKGEFEGAIISVKVNVAGKQKDLQAISDKLTNVFRQIFANPQILENPKAAKIFNKLIEYSGLDPFDFGYATPQNAKQMVEAQNQNMSPSNVPQPVMA